MASRNEVFKLTIDVDAEIKNARAAAESLQKSFSKINLSDSIRNNLNKTFSNLEKELINFETMTSKPFKNMGDVQKAEKSFENITNLFDQLKITAKNVQGMDLEKIMPKDFVRQLDRVKDLYKTVTKEAIEAGKEQQKAASNAKKAIADQNKELKELQKTQKELEGRQQQHQSDKELLSGNYKGRAAALKGNVTKAQNQVEATKEGTVARDIAENEAKNAQKIYNDYIKSIVEAQQREKEWANTHKETETKLKEVNSAIDQANEKIKEQEAIMNAAAESPASLEKLREALSAISGQDLSQIPTDLKSINEMVATLQADKMREVAEQVGVLASEAGKADPSLKTMDERMKDVHNSGEQLAETASEVERLGDRIRYFFSIGNSIRLFKRAIRDAMNTVKELDKAMTETATVTNYSISDMWEQLPRYTEEANKLGTSINSLYKATTLYYQQGLDTNEAMALGVETIKMARVAGMDAAQATDLMTAALRGFNMELNETSAVRVNDVYSELAAVTAADTDEIGIAISKTASIAHSANMEFETTAAFLSQIIETTREAPETAGTAMKTIIARFSEVKKLYSEGQITGTDEEGEVVNVNKIQEALRTVGIDMSKFFTGKEGLDQVLLRLAEKWDTLDVVTQRYIATQAAGSRQQSRFLAMMSDYDRTLQLVDAAYDSAGSGQRQFEKTLESMEAKLAELKNAWDQFIMGIANSDILKGIIGTLTDILGVINKVINAISGGNGLVKSIASIGLSFLALRGGAKIFGNGKNGGLITKFFGSLKNGEASNQAESVGQTLATKIGTGLAKGLNGVGKQQNFSLKNLFTKDALTLPPEVSKDIENSLVASLEKMDIDDEVRIGIYDNFDGTVKGLQKVQQAAKEAGVTFDEKLTTRIKDFSKGSQVSFQKIGAAVMGIGTAFTVVGSLISKTDEEAGKIITDIGSALIGLGSAAMSIIPAIQAVQKAMVTAGVASKTAWIEIIAIIAAVAAIIGIVIAAINNTPEKKLERAQKKAEESAKAAQEAQQAYDDLLSNRNNYNELEEKVKSLTEGTQEWEDAVAELNSKVLELSGTYKGLEYEVDEATGALKITEESWAKVTEENRKKARESQAKALTDQIGASKQALENAKSNRQIVDSEGNVLSEVQRRNLMGHQGGRTIDEWEEELKGRGYSFIDDAEVTKAQKQAEIDRKNLILAFMPDSVDKAEANKVGTAMSSLIGDALDNVTDPNEIEKQIKEFYNLFSTQGMNAKDLFSGKTVFKDSLDYKDFGISDEFYEKYQEQVDNLIAANKDRVLKVKDELARIGTDLSTVGEEDAEALSEKTSKMGTEEAQNYYKAWEKVKNKNKKLASNLLGLEVSNINDLTGIIKMLRDADVAEEDIQEYWKAAIAGGEAFSLKLSDIANRADALSESLKGIDELGKRMEEGSLTGEDIQKLQEAGVDLSTLQRTADGWKLVGDEAKRALQIMKGELIEGEQLTTKALEDLYKEGPEEMAKYFGTGQEIFDPITGQMTYSYNGKETEKRFAEAYQMAQKNQAYAEASRYTAQENEVRGGSEESIIYSAQNQAQQAGYDTEELDAYALSLQGINENLQNNKATAYEVALGNMNLNAGLGEIINSYDDWSGLIDKDSGLIKATTSEDAKAYNDLRKSVNKMLNTSEDLSDEFWNNAENIENVKKAAEGDTEALGELQKAAAKDYLVNLDLDPEGEKIVTDFANKLGDWELPTLEAGVELTGQDEFIAACQEMINTSGMTADQVSEYFKRLGYDVEFDGNPQKVKRTRQEPEISYTIDTDDQGNITKMTPHIEMVPVEWEEEMMAPTIKTLTSTGSGGGGVSSKNLGGGKSNASKGKKGGGGGGKSKKKNNWKNPYDKYYNLTEKINEALRTREKIERDYDRILKRRERTAAELLENSAQEIANLRQEVEYQKRLQAGRREQIQNVAGERYDNGDQITTFEKMGVTKYANYNFDTQTIEIDWAAIEAVRDEELGKAIEAYVSRLEELQGQYEETQDTIEEMEDNIWEINQRGKEEYLSFEQRVLDALIAADQKIIDDLSAKFEGINSANDKILNSMQEQIDLERQIRDNTKTEDDIAQKEARLAYLRRDTSGANATEIMKLEQELADARQNYTDTLIDQGLQKLSDENQRAAEQRQEQIDIMQSIHDWTVESGGFNQKAEELINEAAAAGEVTEAIKTSLQDNEGWTSMTKFAGEKWMTDLANEYKAAMEGMSNFKVDEAKTKNTSSKNALAVTDANGKNQQNVWFDSSKNRWVDSKGNLYDIYYDPKANNGQGGYKYSNKSAAQDENAWLKEYLDSIAGSIGNLGSSSGGSNSGSGGSNVNTGKPNPPKKYYRAQIKDGTTVLWTGTKKQSTPENAEKEGREYLAKMRKEAYEAYEREFSPSSKAYFREILAKWNRGRAFSIAYKTGGLADFTGPAWLDGTKAHPELVLNARDTENFIQLKDILSGMGSLDKLQNGGDNYYNFDIKVDQLASDYDVDKLIGKIKNEIDKDARYRNVNSINFIR